MAYSSVVLSDCRWARALGVALADWYSRRVSVSATTCTDLRWPFRQRLSSRYEKSLAVFFESSLQRGLSWEHLSTSKGKSSFDAFRTRSQFPFIVGYILWVAVWWVRHVRREVDVVADAEPRRGDRVSRPSASASTTSISECPRRLEHRMPRFVRR